MYKVETIGDAYMAVSGLPVPNGIEHSRQVALMSLELVEAIRYFTVPHMPLEQLKLRVGLHSGKTIVSYFWF